MPLSAFCEVALEVAHLQLPAQLVRWSPLMPSSSCEMLAHLQLAQVERRPPPLLEQLSCEGVAGPHLPTQMECWPPLLHTLPSCVVVARL